MRWVLWSIVLFQQCVYRSKGCTLNRITEAIELGLRFEKRMFQLDKRKKEVSRWR